MVVAALQAQDLVPTLENLAGLRRRSPFLAWALTFFLLSLAGIPPLPGFFAKLLVFTAAVKSGDHQGYLWLVLVALAGSCVSLYYYLRVLKAVFRMSEEQANRVMMTAHQRGACVVAVFTRDVAESKASEATELGRQEGYPLMFTTEPEE